MTETAKNTNAPEAPLTWRSRKEWGSEGNTHRASIKLDNGDLWSFVVDQPRKGQWVTRGWQLTAQDAADGRTGSGDMKLYREDRTMKGAKAQAQAHANLAQTSTCAECRKVTGHKMACSTGRAVDAERTRGQRIMLRATDESAALLSRMAGAGRKAAPGISRLADALRDAGRHIHTGLWRGIHRPLDCSCPTPTHRMSCGHGARPVVVRKAGA